MLLIFFFYSVQSQSTLYYEAFTPASFDYQGKCKQQLDWQVLYKNQAPYTYQCGGNKLFGGLYAFDQTNIITNLIQLPPHNLIRITLDFWIFDSTAYPFIFVDYNQIANPTPSLHYNCQNSNYADIFRFDQTIEHNFNNALIVINTTNGFWGVNNFKLYIQKCPLGCLVCDINDRKTEQCITWSLAFSSLNQVKLEDLYISQWQVQNPISSGNSKTKCSNIPLLCGYNECSQGTIVTLNNNIKFEKHSKLKIQFRFFKIDSWDSETVSLDIFNHQKLWSKMYIHYEGYQICGNTFQDLGDNIEINFNHTSLSLNLQFTTSLQADQWGIGIDDESFGLRDFWIFSDNICDVSYYFECCGDSIKQIGEECDDGNYNPFDGCHNCQYSCIENCQYCIQGTCIECQEGWILIQSTQECFWIQPNQMFPQSITYQEYQSQLSPLCQKYANEICIKCQKNYYLNHITGTCDSLCGDGIINGDEQCDYENLDPFKGCFRCKYYCPDTYFQCAKCFMNKCLVCNDNYYLNPLTNSCDSLCGDGIANGIEQCDDGNMIPYDGCYLCKYSCSKNCNECDRGVCLDALYTNEETNNQYCSPYCLTYSSNQCQICIDNYYLNPFTHQCDSLCGDGIVNGKEQCDDGNMLPYDNCYLCQYYCTQDCDTCVNGKCLDINFSIENLIDNQFISQECVDCLNNVCLRCQKVIYFQKFRNICQSICGFKGENLLYSEMYHINFMCERCNFIKQFQCQEKCSFCYFGECIQCDKGYTLDNNECLSICGDSMVNKEPGEQQEECDNPYSEGCVNCKISSQYKCVGEEQSICWTCDSKCTQCKTINDELLCSKCLDGYFPKGLSCEICESRCITCEISPSQCTSCYRKDCKLCEDTEGLYTDVELRKCISICGDGIIVEGIEDCDDGNSQNWDGCNNKCQIELLLENDDSFEVIKEQNNNDLKITNSKKVTLLCSDILINIEGFSKEQYKFNSTNQNGNCQIKFSFLKTIDATNLIHLTIPYNISFSRLLFDEYTQSLTITPRKQIILNEVQEQQVEIITSAKSFLFLIILIVAPLSIIFEVFEYFWAVLEILSWINNFYYLNVTFPFNAQTVLITSDWSSLVNFPTYQELNQPDSEYYFQSPQKFMEKGMDPLFINNAQVPFAFISFTILLYTLCSIVYLFVSFLDKLLIREEIPKKLKKPFQIFQIKRKQTQTQQTIQNNSISIDQVATQIHNKKIVFVKKLIERLNKQLYGRIKLTVSLCILDITLAATLQIVMASQFQYTIILVNQLLAFLSILLIFQQIYQQYLLLNIHPILAENEEFKHKYGCLYEGYNLKSQFGMTYSLIYLIRKVFYIFFTVFCYDNPLIQTSLCFVTSLLGVVLLIYQNPFDTRKQRIIQFIQEGSVSVIVFITILYAFDEQTNLIGEDSKIVSGWIQIAFILLALITEILVLLYEILKAFSINICALYRKIKQNKIRKEVSENKIEKNNIPIKEQVKGNIYQQEQRPRFNAINGVLHYIPKRQIK